MFIPLIRSLKGVVKIVLLFVFMLGKLYHCCHATTLHASTQIGRDKLVQKQSVPHQWPLRKPRYRSWWRALLLLGNYRLYRR